MESSKRSSRAEFWQDVLQQFVDSKWTVIDFCSQKGVSVPSFYQWKRKLLPVEKSPPISAMVPVLIIPSNPKPSTQLTQLIAAIEAASTGESC